jgi:hypothetical protein
MTDLKAIDFSTLAKEAKNYFFQQPKYVRTYSTPAYLRIVHEILQTTDDFDEKKKWVSNAIALLEDRLENCPTFPTKELCLHWFSSFVTPGKNEFDMEAMLKLLLEGFASEPKLRDLLCISYFSSRAFVLAYFQKNDKEEEEEEEEEEEGEKKEKDSPYKKAMAEAQRVLEWMVENKIQVTTSNDKAFTMLSSWGVFMGKGINISPVLQLMWKVVPFFPKELSWMVCESVKYLEIQNDPVYRYEVFGPYTETYEKTYLFNSSPISLMKSLDPFRFQDPIYWDRLSSPPFMTVNVVPNLLFAIFHHWIDPVTALQNDHLSEKAVLFLSKFLSQNELEVAVLKYPLLKETLRERKNRLDQVEKRVHEWIARTTRRNDLDFDACLTYIEDKFFLTPEDKRPFSEENLYQFCMECVGAQSSTFLREVYNFKRLSEFSKKLIIEIYNRLRTTNSSTFVTKDFYILLSCGYPLLTLGQDMKTTNYAIALDPFFMTTQIIANGIPWKSLASSQKVAISTFLSYQKSLVNANSQLLNLYMTTDLTNVIQQYLEYQQSHDLSDLYREAVLYFLNQEDSVKSLVTWLNKFQFQNVPRHERPRNQSEGICSFMEHKSQHLENKAQFLPSVQLYCSKQVAYYDNEHKEKFFMDYMKNWVDQKDQNDHILNYIVTQRSTLKVKEIVTRWIKKDEKDVQWKKDTIQQWKQDTLAEKDPLVKACMEFVLYALENTLVVEKTRKRTQPNHNEEKEESATKKKFSSSSSSS